MTVQTPRTECISICIMHSACGAGTKRNKRKARPAEGAQNIATTAAVAVVVTAHVLMIEPEPSAVCRVISHYNANRLVAARCARRSVVSFFFFKCGSLVGCTHVVCAFSQLHFVCRFSTTTTTTTGNSTTGKKESSNSKPFVWLRDEDKT